MFWDLTCHTPNCLNDNFTVQFPDPEEMVICGGCHQEITDKSVSKVAES